jgi:hypothetical protein
MLQLNAAAWAGGGKGRGAGGGGRTHLKSERRLCRGEPSGWSGRGMAEWELSLLTVAFVVAWLGPAGKMRRTGGDGAWRGGFGKEKSQ